jgi:hypothetical protein
LRSEQRRHQEQRTPRRVPTADAMPLTMPWHARAAGGAIRSGVAGLSIKIRYTQHAGASQHAMPPPRLHSPMAAREGHRHVHRPSAVPSLRADAAVPSLQRRPASARRWRASAFPRQGPRSGAHAASHGLVRLQASMKLAAVQIGRAHQPDARRSSAAKTQDSLLVCYAGPTGCLARL